MSVHLSLSLSLSLSPQCITLSNHVLLRELDLSGNSLSDMGAVEEAWLPSLQTLRVANNW